MLISGYRGWIGARLVEVAQSQGHEVWGIERTQIQNSEFWLSDAQTSRASCAIHLAAKAHVPISATSNVDSYQRANHDHAIRFARIAQAAGIRRFVFVSTAKVLQTRAQDPYTQAKRTAEAALSALHRPLEFEITVVRPPLVYGPRVRANFFRLLKLADSPFPLLLSNNAMRQLVFLDNLVDVLCRLTEAPLSGLKQPTIVYPQDARCVSTAQLMEMLRLRLDRKAWVFNANQDVVSCIRRLTRNQLVAQAVIERLFDSFTLPSHGLELLRWQAPYALEEGLDQTVAWYRKQR